MENKVRKRNLLSIIGSILGNVIYYLILIPLIIISISIVYQHTKDPDKIPDIFGWKMFMVLDEKMYTDINYGDLVFTKNVDAGTLKVGDVIAFRNQDDMVTIHKIIEVNSNNSLNKEIKVFTMQTLENEIESNKYVRESNVEGILKNRIPFLGLILIYMQNPFILFTIICVILVIGLICLYFAQLLDKKDEMKLNNKEETRVKEEKSNNKKKNTNKEK